MSNRFIERVTSTVQAIVTEMNNITQWGGVNVEPAAPKADGQSNAANVPEVGARLESFNGGAWDRVRSGITSVVTSFLGFLDVIPYGVNSGVIVVPPGSGAPLQLDGSGNLKVTGTVISTPATVGTEGNAWLAAAVGAGATSASIDTQFTPFVSIFGSTNAVTTLTTQLSQDNITFYDDDTISVVSPFNFSAHLIVGARFIRLKTSAAITITATISAKGG